MWQTAKAFFGGPIGWTLGASSLLMSVSGLASAVADAPGSPWMWGFFGAFAFVALSFWREHSARLKGLDRVALSDGRSQGYAITRRSWNRGLTECLIKTQVEYHAWEAEYLAWKDGLREVIRQIFSDIEADRFEAPGSPDLTKGYPHFNDNHLIHLVVFDLRSEVLDELIKQ